MFNRPYIKQLAKGRMSGRMGNAIIAGLLALILGGLGSVNAPKWDYKLNTDINFDFLLLPFIIFAGLTAIVYFILVGNVIHIGARGWFLRYWRGEYPPVGELFSGFRAYSSFVTTGLLRDIYLFLWFLLLIIPGIVMSYAYSMADYIVYEYPHIPAGRVLELSKRMTYGHKADLFVFDLSYFGWMMLSALTFGILGIVYVNPYMFTAHAGIYEQLKSDALTRGIIRPEDFGMSVSY